MKYKTVREVLIRKLIENEEEVRKKPSFKIGDYVQIYFGQYENSCFYINDMRYNHNKESFEYYTDSFVYAGWYYENQLVNAR